MRYPWISNQVAIDFLPFNRRLRMWRHTFSWILAIGLALVLGACSSDGTEDVVDGDGSIDGDTSADGDVSPDGDLDADGQGETDGDSSDVELDSDIETGEEELDGEQIEKEEPEDGLPRRLPFDLTRPDAGTPLTEEEITAFTKEMTGFWKQIDYFTWVYETTHGNDASTGKPDYLIWWHDVDAVKEGDTVTFRNNRNYGGSHNNAEPTSFVLAQAAAGHLLTGDKAMARVAEQFAKSFTAMMKGFVYDADDPIDTIMARNIITQNHAFTLPSGKKKAVDYSDWYFSYEGWNANRYNYPNNPTWGDIWVTTMRSKDDLPFMYRAAGWLLYLIEDSNDPAVVAAAKEAAQYMQRFSEDVVDQEYHIRSKDADGNPYIPTEDLASYVDYVDLIPDAECDARLVTALVATGEPLGLDCGSGEGSAYDAFACARHYYNYSIVDHFHMSAIQWALISRQNAMAEALLKGLVARFDRYQDPEAEEPGWKDASWEKDVALYLLQGAALGIPLTSDEVRKIHHFHHAAVEAYKEFPNWNLWDESVPDGVYGFRDGGMYPAHGSDKIRIEDIAFILEYCWSPFKNPTGQVVVDCDIVRDPSRWGE
jgi:hypothetical protein